MPRYYVRWTYEDGGEYFVDAPDEHTAIRAVSERIETFSDYGLSDGMTTYECSDPITDGDDDPHIEHISYTED